MGKMSQWPAATPVDIVKMSVGRLENMILSRHKHYLADKMSPDMLHDILFRH
jgi:hypothetical protein